MFPTVLLAFWSAPPRRLDSPNCRTLLAESQQSRWSPRRRLGQERSLLGKKAIGARLLTAKRLR
ncbi:MAG: hypothetical protein F6J93_09350 [Oscillatoria sp. SIO1A7]|nr:hypothetical protein [Oscillatoria sp. SIO1A7]